MLLLFACLLFMDGFLRFFTIVFLSFFVVLVSWLAREDMWWFRKIKVKFSIWDSLVESHMLWNPWYKISWSSKVWNMVHNPHECRMSRHIGASGNCTISWYPIGLQLCSFPTIKSNISESLFLCQLKYMGITGWEPLKQWASVILISVVCSIEWYFLAW